MKTREQVIEEFKKDMGVKDSYTLTADENYFVDKIVEAYGLVKEEEKKILEATKEFANSHDIPYDHRTESMILNGMREAVKKCLTPDVVEQSGQFYCATERQGFKSCSKPCGPSNRCIKYTNIKT